MWLSRTLLHLIMSGLADASGRSGTNLSPPPPPPPPEKNGFRSHPIPPHDQSPVALGVMSMFKLLCFLGQVTAPPDPPPRGKTMGGGGVRAEWVPPGPRDPQKRRTSATQMCAANLCRPWRAQKKQRWGLWPVSLCPPQPRPGSLMRPRTKFPQAKHRGTKGTRLARRGIPRASPVSGVCGVHTHANSMLRVCGFLLPYIIHKGCRRRGMHSVASSSGSLG